MNILHRLILCAWCFAQSCCLKSWSATMMTPIKKVAGRYQPAHLLEVAQQAIDPAAQGGIQ